MKLTSNTVLITGGATPTSEEKVFTRSAFPSTISPTTSGRD